MKTTLPIRRWNTDEFDRMIELGLLAPRGYELLDGVVYNTNGFARRWSAYDFDRMAEGGVITQEERAELVEGAVFEPRSFWPLHASIRTRIIYTLHKAVHDDESVMASPTGYVLLDDSTIVAPEVFLLTREAFENWDAWPRAGDVPLIIEILNPLYSAVVETKQRIYAQFGIPELWHVDPVRGMVTVFHSAELGEYREVADYRRGESWSSPALRGREVRVEDVVGPAR